VFVERVRPAAPDSAASGVTMPSRMFVVNYSGAIKERVSNNNFGLLDTLPTHLHVSGHSDLVGQFSGSEASVQRLCAIASQ
jgi:hypothetical protein